MSSTEDVIGTDKLFMFSGTAHINKTCHPVREVEVSAQAVELAAVQVPGVVRPVEVVAEVARVGPQAGAAVEARLAAEVSQAQDLEAEVSQAQDEAPARPEVEAFQVADEAHLEAEEWALPVEEEALSVVVAEVRVRARFEPEVFRVEVHLAAVSEVLHVEAAGARVDPLVLSGAEMSGCDQLLRQEVLALLDV